jgi:phosphonate transport system substrate-binding protein
MTINFTVSPSFPNERISDWYIFNTWMQRSLEISIHLELYDSFKSQRAAIAEGKVDMIYANPFDASLLVREKGFKAIAKPADHADEMVVFTAAGNEINQIRDLKPGTRLAYVDDPAINTIGHILLEPANLDESNLQDNVRDTYIQVAKEVLRGNVDVGFMPVEAFNSLSSLVQRDLKVLVTSEMQSIQHVFLVGPSALEKADTISALLASMHETDKGQSMLTSLGLSRWQILQQEDVEFMIDIISTLGH